VDSVVLVREFIGEFYPLATISVVGEPLAAIFSRWRAFWRAWSAQQLFVGCFGVVAEIVDVVCEFWSVLVSWKPIRTFVRRILSRERLCRRLRRIAGVDFAVRGKNSAVGDRLGFAEERAFSLADARGAAGAADPQGIIPPALLAAIRSSGNFGVHPEIGMEGFRLLETV